MDPAGTMAGGFFKSDTCILSKVIQMRKLEEELGRIEGGREGLMAEFRDYQNKRREYENLSRELKLKTFQLEKLTREIKMDEEESEIETLKRSLEEVEAEKQRTQTQLDSTKSKL